MNTSRLDAHLTAGPPVDLAWERWAESAIIGDRCEVMAPLGGGLLATIEHATDLDVTVRTDTGDTLTLDWSDVGPVTGY